MSVQYPTLPACIMRWSQKHENTRIQVIKLSCEYKLSEINACWHCTDRVQTSLNLDLDSKQTLLKDCIKGVDFAMNTSHPHSAKKMLHDLVTF